MLTYINPFSNSGSKLLSPTQMYPVAFIRIKFRKGLKYKIKPVAGPNIELLKQCMMKMGDRGRAGRRSVDYANTPGLFRQNPTIKPTDHRLHSDTAQSSQMRRSTLPLVSALKPSGKGILKPSSQTSHSHSVGQSNKRKVHQSTFNKSIDLALASEIPSDLTSKSASSKNVRESALDTKADSEDDQTGSVPHIKFKKFKSLLRGAFKPTSSTAKDEGQLKHVHQEKSSVDLHSSINLNDSATQKDAADDGMVVEPVQRVGTRKSNSAVNDSTSSSSVTITDSTSDESSTVTNRTKNDSCAAIDSTNAESVKQPAVVRLSSGSDGESEDSVTAPRLRYTRSTVLSSDSLTESETDSPTKAPPRRSQRIIESDESEVEDAAQKKKRMRAESQRRRSSAAVHTVKYSSDTSTLVIRGDHGPVIEEFGTNNDDSQSLEAADGEFTPPTASPSAEGLCKSKMAPFAHPLLPDCSVLLGLLHFPDRVGTSGLVGRTAVEFKSIDFRKESWGATPEPDDVTLPEKIEKDTSTADESRTSGKMVNEAEDEKPMMKYVSGLASEVSNANGDAVKKRLKNFSLESFKKGQVAKSEGKDVKFLKPAAVGPSVIKEKHQSAEPNTSASSTATKGSKVMKSNAPPAGASSHPSLTKKNSSEHKKQVVYEEVDIFASVRGLPIDAARRKKRTYSAKESAVTLLPVAREKDVIPSTSAAGVKLQDVDLQTTNVSRKSVRFNLSLNITHTWEADTDDTCSIRKNPKDGDVGEAFPMKRRIAFPTIPKPVVVPSPAPSIIDKEKLQPVIDGSKDYPRIPALPLFHEKPRNDSLPKTVPKEPDQVGYKPCEHPSDDYVPMPEALLRPPSDLLNPAAITSPDRKLVVTAVIPGVNTPHSPSPVEDKSEEESDEVDVDEMLEESEAVKNAQKQSSSSQASTFSVIPSMTASPVKGTTIKALTGEISKLVNYLERKSFLPATIPLTTKTSNKFIPQRPSTLPSTKEQNSERPETSESNDDCSRLVASSVSEAPASTPSELACDRKVEKGSSLYSPSEPTSVTDMLSDSNMSIGLFSYNTPPPQIPVIPTFSKSEHLYESSTALTNTQNVPHLPPPVNLLESFVTPYANLGGRQKALPDNGDRSNYVQEESDRLKYLSDIPMPTQCSKSRSIFTNSSEHTISTSSESVWAARPNSSSVIPTFQDQTDNSKVENDSDPETPPLLDMELATPPSSPDATMLENNARKCRSSSNSSPKLELNVRTSVKSTLQTADVKQRDTDNGIGAFNNSELDDSLESPKLQIDISSPQASPIKKQILSFPVKSQSSAGVSEQCNEKLKVFSYAGSEMKARAGPSVPSLTADAQTTSLDVRKLNAAVKNMDFSLLPRSLVNSSKLHNQNIMPSAVEQSSDMEIKETDPLPETGAALKHELIVSDGEANETLILTQSSEDVPNESRCNYLSPSETGDSQNVIAEMCAKQDRQEDKQDKKEPCIALNISIPLSDISLDKSHSPDIPAAATPSFTLIDKTTPADTVMALNTIALKVSLPVSLIKDKKAEPKVDLGLSVDNETLIAQRPSTSNSESHVLADKESHVLADKESQIHVNTTLQPLSVVLPPPLISGSEKTPTVEESHSSIVRESTKISTNTIVDLSLLKGRKLPRSLVLGESWKSPSQEIGGNQSDISSQTPARKRPLSPSSDSGSPSKKFSAAGVGSPTSRLSKLKQLMESGTPDKNQPENSVPSVQQQSNVGDRQNMDTSQHNKEKRILKVSSVEQLNDQSSITKQAGSIALPPGKRNSFRDEGGIRWTNSLEKMSKIELESVSRCVEFLLDLKDIGPITDPISYVDPYLNSMDEEARIGSLSMPLFHNSEVRGCASVADLSITFTNDLAKVYSKPDTIFWETCPLSSQISTEWEKKCACVTSTLAKELLARNEKSINGFDDQDEIDTVRVAIAYSQSNMHTEHIVNLSPCRSLFEHISSELVDKINRMLSLSHAGINNSKT